MAFQIQGTTIIQDDTDTHLGSSSTPQPTSVNIGTGAGGSGGDNTAVGWFAMNGSGGSENTAIGSKSMIDSTNGARNTAVGKSSGQIITSGNDNVGIGSGALHSAGGADQNVGVGKDALRNNSESLGSNVAVGHQALKFMSSRRYNTAVGAFAGESATGGTFGYNILVGAFAGRNTTGWGQVYITSSGSTLSTSSGSNNIVMGYRAEPSSSSVSNEITLGNSFITNLRCNDTTISGLSDERDKTDVIDLDWSTDFIKDMRPVKFSWNRRDGSMEGKKDLGFIAQELDSLEEKYSSHEYTRLVHKDDPEKLEADPMKTYPIVIKALQDLILRVEELEKQLNPA